jgi:hypothetical protein
MHRPGIDVAYISRAVHAGSCNESLPVWVTSLLTLL